MEQELRACKKGSIKKLLHRHGGALVDVEVIRPRIRLISGQHRERKQNGPPCEQGVKCLLITSDRGEDVSVVIAEVRPRRGGCGTLLDHHCPKESMLDVLARIVAPPQAAGVGW